MMCLFLWQASTYPVLGQGSKNTTTTGAIKITVRQGETLWALAQNYHTTVDKIVKFNHAKNPNLIRVGDILWIPNGYENKNIKTNHVSADVKDYSNSPRSSDPQQPESKIPTYEIIVNQDAPLLNESPKSTSSDTDDSQKREAQKTVRPGTESQVLSRSLGRLVSIEDVELLTRVIYGEARGENFEGQVAVGAVVLNRLKDPRFPKTMRAIIYQSGAFTAVDDRQIHLDPDDIAYKAADAALSGLDPTNGAIYYYNPRIATDRWIKSRPVVKRIGNHTFSI
jgi:N-acetylmuramoyl-L-alanine amidase